METTEGDSPMVDDGHGTPRPSAPTSGGRGAAVAPRAASDDDTGAVALLHVEQIATGFLSSLGPGFLGLLYRRIIRHPGSFLMVAQGAGGEGVRGADDVVGFIAGTDDVGALYRSFLWHDGARAVAGSFGHLTHEWRRVLETLRHGGGVGGGAVGRGTELLAMAVAPEQRGAGVGARLVEAFLARVASGATGEAYVVVGAGNAAALRLYRRAGFSGDQAFELHAGAGSLILHYAGPTDVVP